MAAMIDCISSPFISVVMCCYNAEQWLRDSIESVLNQTYGDFEFIIVDDGSSDKTLSILREYANLDARVLVVEKSNSGLTDSLNVAINLARGQWIARIDADDICEANRFQLQVSEVIAYPSLVYLGGGLVLIDERGHLGRVYRYPSTHDSLVKSMATARRFPAHSSAFFKAEAFRSVGGYRTRFRRSQDLDLWLRLSEVGEMAALDKTLVRIRKHSAQVSHEDSGRRQVIDARMAIVSYWLRRNGFMDPVDCDELRYVKYREWLEKQLLEDGVFSYLSRVVKMRTDYSRISGGAKRVSFLVCSILINPRFFVKIVSIFLFGERRMRSLSLEWGRVAGVKN